VLGAVRIERDGRLETRFRTQKTAALLAFLALHTGRPVPREDLIGLLWPDAEFAQGRNSLSQAISSLRHQLEPPETSAGSVLVADRTAVSLDQGVWVDLSEVVRLERIGDYEAALELIGGPFAAGLGEAWIKTERDSLRNRFEAFAVRSARRLLGEEEFGRAAIVAKRWLSADPACEATAEIAVQALIAQGRRDEAKVVVAELTRNLRALGLRPTSGLKDLLERVKPDPGPAVIDEGPPESVPRVEPPALRIRIPQFHNAFFGREEEVARLAENLAPESGRRVATSTGPGGAGKTRLSIEAVQRLQPAYGDRLWFVPLADARTSDELLAGIAAAIGFASAQKPSPESLAEAIGSEPALLVLDNLEQLLEDGATTRSIRALIDLSGARILASSRRRLGIEGEIEIRVGPLQVPDPGAEASDVEGNACVALFVDRARAVRPDFQLTPSNSSAVAELCRALDGIPLAIELAASRAQVLGPAQMLERLPSRLDVFVGRERDSAARHHTMRNAIEWSYCLLHPSLQRFFAGLSVFHGGWTLEAAEEVLEEPLALDYLAELVEFSMIGGEEDSFGSIRFSMLETLRTFALEVCERQSVLDERHLHHYLALAEEAEPFLTKPEFESWQERLDAERGNLRSALTYAIQQLQPEIGLRFVAALWRYWHQRGLVAEGREWAEKVLALPIEGLDGEVLASALHGAARLAYLQGDYSTARARSELAHRLFRRRPNMHGIALCLTSLGSVGFEEGEYALARAYFRGALAIWRVLDDRFGIGAALNWLGIVYTDLREYQKAEQVLKESLEVREAIGDWLGVARALNSLGIVARQQGDLESAGQHYSQSLELARRAGDRRAQASCLSNLGMVALSRGELQRAEELLHESLDIHREVGDKWGIAAALANLGNLAADSGRLQEANEHLKGSLEIRRKIGNRSGVALALEGLGVVASRAGDSERAVLLFARAARLREEIGSPPAPADASRVEEALAQAQALLGTAWKPIWEAGMAENIDELFWP